MFSILALTACGKPSHTPYKNESPNGGLGGGPPPNPTFAAVKANILDPQCVSCHKPGGRAFDLTTFEAIAGQSDLIVAGNPKQSLLLAVIEDGSMPPRGTVPAEAIEILRQWILEGALNN
jgi:hypothetical protein